MTVPGENDSAVEAEGQLTAHSGRTTQEDISAFRALLEQWGSWGPRPWLRLAVLIPLLVPAFLLFRVGAVVHWKQHDTWVAISVMDLSNWVQVALGSFYAWLPWSGYVIAVPLVFYIAMSVRVLKAANREKRRRRRSFGIETYDDAGGMIFYYLLPWAAATSFGLIYARAGDYRGAGIVAAAVAFGIVYGTMNFHSQGKSRVTVLQFIQQVQYPRLPRIEGTADAAALISITTGAQSPLVLREVDGNTLEYCDTEELLTRICHRELHPSATGPGFWKRCPIVAPGTRVTELQNELIEGKAAQVCLVRIDTELRELYGTDGGHGTLDTSSRAEEVFAAMAFTLVTILLGAIMAAATSPAPWLPRQCLELSDGAPSYGYAITDTGAGVLVITDEPRRSILVDELTHLADEKCHQPQ